MKVELDANEVRQILFEAMQFRFAGYEITRCVLETYGVLSLTVETAKPERRDLPTGATSFTGNIDMSQELPSQL